MVDVLVRDAAWAKTVGPGTQNARELKVSCGEPHRPVASVRHPGRDTLGVESGGWLRSGSTTARGEIWIAGVSPRGPWLLSIDHLGVAAELAALPTSPVTGPGLATFEFDTLTALHAAIYRDDGVVLASPELSGAARSALGIERTPRLSNLREAHCCNLSAHRAKHGFAVI
jgi:hypothetical protein